MVDSVRQAGATQTLDDFKRSLAALSIDQLLAQYPSLATSANKLQRSEGQAIHHELALRDVNQLIAAGEAIKRQPETEDNRNRFNVIVAVLAAQDIHPSWLAVGTAIRDGALGLQNAINRGVDAFEKSADDAAKNDPMSVGNPQVASLLGGAFKGVTTLVTGTVALAGSGVRLVDGRARDEAATTAANVAAHPRVVVANLSHGVAEAWHKNPFDVIGQAASWAIPVALSVRGLRAASALEAGGEAVSAAGETVDAAAVVSRAAARVQAAALRTAAKADLASADDLYATYNEIRGVVGGGSPAMGPGDEALNALVAKYNPGGPRFSGVASQADNDAAFKALKSAMQAAKLSPRAMADADLRLSEEVFKGFKILSRNIANAEPGSFASPEGMLGKAARAMQASDVDRLNALVAKYNAGGPIFSAAATPADNELALQSLKKAIALFKTGD